MTRPKKPGIRFTGNLSRLRAKPGDVLVVQVDKIMSHEQMVFVRDHVSHAVPGVQVLVLSDGLKLGLLDVSEIKTTA